MKCPSPSRSVVLRAALSGLVLLPFALVPISNAQQNSGAAAITLTAVLSQSLTVSVTPERSSSGEFFATAVTGPSQAELPLSIQAGWVRGQARPSLDVFATGNPLLGANGRYAIPLKSSPVEAGPEEPGISSFLAPAARSQDVENATQLRFTTKDFEIPSGSESGTMTIRAQAL
jgi:hypothetical protein